MSSNPPLAGAGFGRCGAGFAAAVAGAFFGLTDSE